MNGQMIKLFVMAFFVFVITDTIWLGFIAKSLYFKHYGAWMRLVDGQLQLIWWAAVLVYLLFALSMVIFIIPLAHQSSYCALGYGAILGAIIYGVYNCTCIAIFKDFPIGMGLLDSLWGAVLFAWTSWITHYVGTSLSILSK